MSSGVKVFDRDSLERRRASVLERVGVTEQDLRERGARYALTADEMAVLDELNGLDYLRDGAQSRV